MDEVISLIFHGFKVVKDLEMNLPILVTQHSDLKNSCDEIIRVFVDAKERLNVLEVAAYGGQTEIGDGGGGLVQEWLRFSQAMDMAVHHASQEVHHRLQESGRADRMGFDQAANARESSGGDVAVQPMDVGDTSGGSPVQRTQRRKEAERRTIRVPAPRMGNTELPPEDGYTWRKYGQKEILGSRFPRAYYRCTHQKLYNCPAKKQVQRQDNDPFMFEVTYRGNHTCTMSTTAPSIPPPPITAQSPPVLRPAASVPLSYWLSMDIRTSRDQGTMASSSSNSNFDMEMYKDQFGLIGGGGGGGGISGTTIGGGGDPSSVRYADYHQGVADLAVTMFNSGSSSNNSMELIFSSKEDKWEGPDQKNN